MKNNLTITISGSWCSGKSTMAHIIEKMLAEYGITVVDMRDGHETQPPCMISEPLDKNKIFAALKDKKIIIETVQTRRLALK